MKNKVEKIEVKDEMWDSEIEVGKNKTMESNYIDDYNQMVNIISIFYVNIIKFQL